MSYRNAGVRVTTELERTYKTDPYVDFQHPILSNCDQETKKKSITWNNNDDNNNIDNLETMATPYNTRGYVVQYPAKEAIHTVAYI